MSVFVGDSNLSNEPLVIRNSQGHFFFKLSSADSGMLQAVEYGVKHNLILVSQTIFTDKYSCPSCILRTLLKNHRFLTNVIVLVALKIYILSSVLQVSF